MPSLKSFYIWVIFLSSIPDTDCSTQYKRIAYAELMKLLFYVWGGSLIPGDAVFNVLILTRDNKYILNIW